MGGSDDTVMLFRSVGPVELELIRKSQFRTFPPRLPEQPIFYPVLTEDYAPRSPGIGTSLLPARAM